MLSWTQTVDAMPDDVRERFLNWWREHPPFSHSLDMHALVAEAWAAAWAEADGRTPTSTAKGS